MKKVHGIGLRKAALIVAPIIDQAEKDLLSGLKEGGEIETFILDEIETAFSLKDKDEEKDMIRLLNAICDGSFKKFQALNDAIEKRNKRLMKKILRAGLRKPTDWKALERAIEHAEGYRR